MQQIMELHQFHDAGAPTTLSLQRGPSPHHSSSRHQGAHERADGAQGDPADRTIQQEVDQASYANSMASQLRARAVAMLDSLHGQNTRSSMLGSGHQQLPLLLRAWARLNEVAYFWAPLSPVQRCKLCVAMYQACENQWFAQQGDVSPVWSEEAHALAACMPVPPSPEWLNIADVTPSLVQRTAVS